MTHRLRPNDSRTHDQILEHYRLEKELAARLRSASKAERRTLYRSLYDELFRRLPHHPQHTAKVDPAARQANIAQQVRFLQRFASSESVFLEVGPGDCALSLAMASHVKQVYAVDVSDEITRGIEMPDNFRLILSDGCSIPVPENSVDVAFSDQLMEHLHPDDAMEQLRNLHRALRPGGRYVCITPSRLSGPHDVSRHFDPVATCFHLREYSFGELDRLFREAGFRKTLAFVGARGCYARAPLAALRTLECLLDLLPPRLRYLPADTMPFRAVLGVRLVGVK